MDDSWDAKVVSVADEIWGVMMTSLTGNEDAPMFGSMTAVSVPFNTQTHFELHHLQRESLGWLSIASPMGKRMSS